MAVISPWTGAGDAVSQQVRQRIVDQLTFAQKQQDMDLAQRKQAMLEQEAQQRAEEHQTNMASLAEQRAAGVAKENEQRVNLITSRLKPGQTLDAPDAQALPNYLTTPQGVTPPAAPDSLAEGDQSAELPGTVANAPSLKARNFRYVGTDKQQTDEENKRGMLRLIQTLPQDSPERRALEYEQVTGKNAPTGMFGPKAPTNLVQVDEGGKPVYRPASEAAGKPAYRQPQPTQTVTIQTVDDQGNPVTRVVPKSDAMGKDFKKGPSAVTQNRLDSAQAVQQTGEDIINQLSTPAFRAAVGPALGRANTLRDFIGNPPPEYSELAGQIESYALANMGVHGMRSAQGAQQISKLLDQHHTPESLIATIRGLNGFSRHFLGNAGRGTSPPAAAGGTVHMKAPDGRDLNVPPEKVAGLEQLGAKRVQ